MADADPVFWREWEQLGHAVVVQAVEDYIHIRKMEAKMALAGEMSGEMKCIHRFFRSKYFGRICPEYDGWELLDMLNDNWHLIKKGHHYTRKNVKDTAWYRSSEPPKKSGQYDRKKSKWGKQHGTAME